jgi:hypothetical protein
MRNVIRPMNTVEVAIRSVVVEKAVSIFACISLAWTAWYIVSSSRERKAAVRLLGWF